MKIKSAKILAYTIFTLALAACGGSTLIIEKPAESYVSSPIEPALSEIPVRANIDIKKLETSINRKLNGLIYSGDSLMDKDLSVKVWKVQDFSFTIVNNTIVYRLPLKVRAKYSWKVEKFGFSVSDNYEVSGTISLSFKTSLFINKDWKLFARTESAGYQWLEEPRLNIAGIRLPVTRIADLAMSQSKESITKSIDKALSDAVKLQDQIKSVWESVQKPMLVNPENNLWIKVTPSDIFISPFVSNNNILTIAFALQTRVESVAGATPSFNAIIPLPTFKQFSRPPKPFSLNIAADVTYEKLGQIISAQLAGKTFSEGKRSITINSISLYSSEGKVVVAADVTGSLKGRIYFMGKMIFNPDKNTIEVTEPDFDIRTRNVLVKSADWLLHGMILKKITPYLTYNVSDVLETVKTEVNKQLAGYEVYGGVKVTGSLDKLSVTELAMVPGAVRLKASLSGNIGFEIGDLRF
jgi:hypothetical protein